MKIPLDIGKTFRSPEIQDHSFVHLDLKCIVYTDLRSDKRGIWRTYYANEFMVLWLLVFFIK